ncbi:MAG: HD domain-containing protein [Lachnospiraceae bacterium]|nr:HD domain-containing protein [Lachnospiraceae bacterium]
MSKDIVSAENITGADYDKVSVDFTGQNEGYSAVIYNNSNGLPTSEANAIAETEEGFIWIGSYSGLIKYDGNTFERIDSRNGITSVVSLYVDSKNRLWIGTNDNGAFVMDKGEVTMFKDSAGTQSLSIRSITEDRTGNIILATSHGINVVDENFNLYKLDEPQINDLYINEIRRDDNTGIIYGITKNGAVFTIENCKITGFYDPDTLKIQEMTAILPDPENPGYIYAGTSGTEFYYGSLKDGMANAKVVSMYSLRKINSMEYIDKKLWICTDNGIGMYDSSGFRKIYNLPVNNSIDQMLTDYEGNLWFASSRQGVLKIVRNRFTDISAKYNLDEAVVNTTCRYNTYLLMGTDNGLVAVEGGDKVSKIAIKQKYDVPEKFKDCSNLIELLDGVRIRSIIKDDKNRLWISTNNTELELGLIEFDNGNIRCFNEKKGLPSDKPRTVYIGSDDRIYVACSGGLAIIENDRIVETYDEKSGISNPEILTVTEGFKEDIVLGTDGDGIYVLKDKKIVNIGLKEGLESMIIMRIKKDEKRNLFWIVTSNSIAYMDTDYNVTTVNKFPYSNNFDIYENKDGKMWVLSSNGVYVSDVNDLLENEEINADYYSMDNGLSCVTTANSYSYLTEEGDLYIAGTTGVAKVNIDNDFNYIEEIKMAVPYVDADGELIFPNENGEIIVPANVKRVTVYGYVYSYSLMNPIVTYYLEGFDKTPITVDRKSFEPVAYTNLRGKTYHFIMRLKDTAGNGENTMSVTIVKQKSYYETVVFYLFLAVAAGLILYELIIFVVNRKTKALVKKQNETKLYIREMTEAIARTIDMKDRYTKGHSIRVAEYTAMLTKELGYDEDTIERYYNIALLHDIGKIGIKPEVLNKAGKLTDEEFTLIKSHSIQGYNVLKDISIMPELATGARSHHERPDGHGYPDGKVGDEIPRAAQIIAVADTFDAMYSDRPYRKRMNFDKAVSIIKEVSGTQLTEDVVEAFLRIVERGELRSPDDDGGGTTEDITNIRLKYKKEDESKDIKEKE